MTQHVVPYELSKKLHERYPEMGKESYFVHVETDVWLNEQGDTERKVLVLTRAEVAMEIDLLSGTDLAPVIKAPALTLGELMRSEQFHRKMRGFERYDILKDLPWLYYGSDDFNPNRPEHPESALAQAILAKGGE